MPILVRPVREQIEHDRIIRLLLARYQPKHDSVTNIHGEPPTSIMLGTLEFVPDLILLTTDKARKLEGVVEVETGESVNSLETLAQWVPFGKLRVPFHLYVPPQSLDTVRRLCRDHNVTVAELWTYHTNLDQVRFTLVQKATDAALAAARKIGIAGTPKLKVAPPPPPPPPPLPLQANKASEMKAPVRTAAQKVALGKFVAAAKASAFKQGPPAVVPAAAQAAAANAKHAASRAKLGIASSKAAVVAVKAPVKPEPKAVVKPAPVAKPTPAPAAKPAAKASAKPPAKPAPKPAPKPPVKAVAKAAQPVVKPAAKKPVPPARGATRSAGAKRR